MRCFTEQMRVCTGGAAPCAKPEDGEEECPAPEPEECTVETVSACLPRYLGVCEDASDCGEGFSCEPAEECSCGGSSGSAGSDGAGPEDAPDGEEGEAFAPADAGAPIPPDECTCEPTGTNHCVAVRTACTDATSNAVCPSGWTCEDNPDGVCFSGPEGSGCTPADPAKLCTPPFSDLGGSRGSDGEEGGNAVGGGSGPPNVANGDDDVMSRESDGCSVTTPSRASSGALLGFALAALGLTLARRRR
jgi:MYXO-CTERM domain-containing protein